MSRSESGILVYVSWLDHGAGLKLPTYQSAGAAGADLVAACPANSPIILKPCERALVPTGLTLALPEGYEAQIRPRSGLAYKHAVTVLNAPGTIDADYRGEIKVLLINHGCQNFVVERTMRIAQMVIAPVSIARFELVEQLQRSHRGSRGFGSTGT